MTLDRMREILIERDWRGRPAPANEHVRLGVALVNGLLRIDVEAPFHGDPPPPGPAGSLDGLWEFEVAELFLLGEDERYLEVELSPHGHHLALALHGRRHIATSIEEVAYTVSRVGERWRGEARLDGSHLPPGLCAHNAYAIHGVGTARRYLAAHPVPGAAPDFHRLEAFAPIAL